MEQVCLLLDAKAAKVTMAIKQSGEKVLGRSEEAAARQATSPYTGVTLM